MKRLFIIIFFIFLFIATFFFSLRYLLPHLTSSKPNGLELGLPFATPTPTPLPYLAYTIPQLAEKEKNQPTQAAPITIIQLYNTEDTNATTNIYLFTYLSQGKTVSGTLTISKKLLEETDNTHALPFIVMARGYVPPEIYYPGNGTKNAARVLAENGFVTFAPDFLGFGKSDAESDDAWVNRFVKISNMLDLIHSLQNFPQLQLPVNAAENTDLNHASMSTKITQLENEHKNYSISLNPQQMGIWGHSNGGQIAVTTLEVLGQNIPTSVWAPVLAPFPYSVLYFSDEEADEGKETRKFIAQFEKDYDVFDFSLTKHLDLIQGPLQIQHGTNDDSALVSWSEEFLQKVKAENNRRQQNQEPKIETQFYKYPGADHNLQGAWDTAIERDVSFFKEKLQLNN